MRREEMEEHFNSEAKHAWRFAADAARITDEKASSEDRKHSSLAYPEEMKEEGPDMVNIRGGMPVFAAYFWHSKG